MSNIYSISELISLGVTVYGKNILVSKLARLYNPKKLILHDNIRIDDFTILSGKGRIVINKYVHIGPQCFVSSASNIIFSDFCGIACGVKLFGSSDNYNGNYLTGPTVPLKYNGTKSGDIILEKHTIVGSGSIVLPDIELKIGTAIGALSLVNKNTEPWKIYGGNPIKYLKDRNDKCLVLEKELFETLMEKTN